VDGWCERPACSRSFKLLREVEFNPSLGMPYDFSATAQWASIAEAMAARKHIVLGRLYSQLYHYIPRRRRDRNSWYQFLWQLHRWWGRHLRYGPRYIDEWTRGIAPAPFSTSLGEHGPY
jgi:hypothetical protein